MDKQVKKVCENVGPGWWPILEKYIPQILAIDPAAELEVKEKYGTLRIWVGSEKDDLEQLSALAESAEKEAVSVCEVCGAAGSVRKQRWVQTLCDRCAELAPNERYRLGRDIANQLDLQEV